MGTVWTPQSVNSSQFDPTWVRYLATENGDVLQTENSDNLVLEANVPGTWTPQTTNSTVWS